MAGWTPAKRYRHKTRGTIHILQGCARLQTSTPLTDMAEVVVYFSEDGECWVRSKAEFFDGRFEAIPSSLRRKGKAICR